MYLGGYAKKDPRSIQPLDAEINSLKDANELQISTQMLNP